MGSQPSAGLSQNGIIFGKPVIILAPSTIFIQKLSNDLPYCIVFFIADSEILKIENEGRKRGASFVSSRAFDHLQ